jgi:hypothetical protein
MLDEQTDEQQTGQGIPTLYVDGEPVDNFDDMCEAERVQVEWLDVANGYSDGLVNSCAIDWTGEEFTVTISTGDPRGAFCMTVRQLSDGRRILHVPYADASMLHEDLTEDHPGTYVIG